MCIKRGTVRMRVGKVQKGVGAMQPDLGAVIGSFQRIEWGTVHMREGQKGEGTMKQDLGTVIGSFQRIEWGTVQEGLGTVQIEAGTVGSLEQCRT